MQSGYRSKLGKDKKEGGARGEMNSQKKFAAKGQGSKSWQIAISLFVICFVQLCALEYFGKQKSFLMCDELFTYTSSNNAEIQAFDMPLNEWLDRDWYLSQGAAMEGHTFEYAIPYRNQAADVHPPLYYILMHTLCSFVPGQIVFALGTRLNIFFMLGCTLLLYLLATEVFGRREIGLVTAALFGITYGACNMVLFVRMYTMMTFIALAHVYVYLRFLEEKRLTWKHWLLFGSTLILGVLTHYYFILLAFFLAAWYFVKFWMQKRFKEECFFHVSIEVCALISLVIFPPMWNHIFNDYRGEEAREALVGMGGFGGRLKAMLRFLDAQLFGGWLWLLLMAGVILLVIYGIKYKNFPLRELKKLFPILFMTGGYFVLVTKIAPYATDRYLMPIYPFVYLIAVGGLCWLLGKLIPQKPAVAVCAIAFLGLSVGSLSKGAPGYAFTDFKQHLEQAREYSDRYCVYIDREYNWWEYYGVIQLLKEYKGFYCISYAAITDDIQTGMEALEDENDVIVFVGDSELNEEITAYIQDTVGAQRMTLLDEYNRWKIYLAERDGGV